MEIKEIEITRVRLVLEDNVEATMMPKEELVKRVQQPAEVKVHEPKAKKERRAYSRFDADQKADIIRRYKAGEGPKAISESLGCSRSLITHIIRDAGAVEGRTGAHLNRKTDQPKEEPV